MSRARPPRGDKGIRPVTGRLACLLDAADHRFFRAPDLDAVARGWEVRRERRFHRVYRDPRFALISRCSDCSGTGLLGTRPCPACAGQGTVMATTVAARFS